MHSNERHQDPEIWKWVIRESLWGYFFFKWRDDDACMLEGRGDT